MNGPFLTLKIPSRAQNDHIPIFTKNSKPINLSLIISTIVEISISTTLTKRYGVVNKKLLHKSEDKMHKKMKVTLQRAKNLVHLKQHYDVSFYNKTFVIF